VHFVIAGPKDTDFEGGLYHGRITLPPSYPHAPPEFRFLTPNGRFETGVKICLSISSHHPEHWQPSWGVRTALTALAAFLPTPGHGAIGALDHSAAERRAAAARSRLAPPRFGGPERQAVTDALHARIVAKQLAVAEKAEKEKEAVVGEEEGAGLAAAEAEAAAAPAAAPAPAEPEPAATAAPAPAPAAAPRPRSAAPRPAALPQQPPPAPPSPSGDRALALLALLLAAAVALLLARKLRAALLVGDDGASAAPILGSSAASSAAHAEL
jgi:ubiquitin-conjugating enzyme E2 J1